MYLGKILTGGAALMLALVIPAAVAKDRLSFTQGQSVTVPAFSALQVFDGGSITVRQSGSYTVTVRQGASRVELFNDGGTLTIQCRKPCRNNVRRVLEVTAPLVNNVTVRGGGSVTFSGGFSPLQRFDADISRGGSIDAFGVSATEVNAAVTGGGTIRVTVTETLGASVVGAGQIIYDGDPSVSYGKIAGGTIQKR